MDENLIIVDTSSWINYFRGESYPEIDTGLKAGHVFVPQLVVAELISGAKSAKNIHELSGFLSELPTPDATFSHWIRVGALRGQLLKKGLSVSTPDAHVAQCAIDLNAKLISGDKIFAKMQKLVGIKI